MDPCCAEAQSFEAEAEACESLAAVCDPTLEACCQRDLEQQALVARLKAQLSMHDSSKQRLRLAGQVLGAAPPATAADATSQPQVKAELGEELDEEADDQELVRLHTQRLHELQREAEQRARLQHEGHGCLTDIPESRLLREAESCAVPVVCHLAFEGSPLDDELDEHLATLAHQYPGTRFMRTPINLRSTLHLRLRTPPGPGLLCFRAGALVGAAPLERFGAPECVMEEAVDKWLRQCRVLRLYPTSSGQAGSSGMSGRRVGSSWRHDSSEEGSSSSEEEEEGEDWQQPCEVCGRRYPHQHIRSVQSTRGRGNDSDSD